MTGRTILLWCLTGGVVAAAAGCSGHIPDAVIASPETAATPSGLSESVRLDREGDRDWTAEMQPATDASPAIYEDESGWDCETMGNHICGIDVKDKHYLVLFDSSGAPISATLSPVSY